MKQKSMDINIHFEQLSPEELRALKGGKAAVVSTEQEPSNAGDGAEYVCCIKIKRKKEN